MTTYGSTRYHTTRAVIATVALLTACGVRPSDAEVELPFR